MTTNVQQISHARPVVTQLIFSRHWEPPLSHSHSANDSRRLTHRSVSFAQPAGASISLVDGDLAAADVALVADECMSRGELARAEAQAWELLERASRVVSESRKQAPSSVTAKRSTEYCWKHERERSKLVQCEASNREGIVSSMSCALDELRCRFNSIPRLCL